MSDLSRAERVEKLDQTLKSLDIDIIEIIREAGLEPVRRSIWNQLDNTRKTGLDRWISNKRLSRLEQAAQRVIAKKQQAFQNATYQSLG